MDKKSFTLVELLIVILIIGVLAAVIAPRMVAMDRKAKEAAAKRNLAALRAAINFYKADHGFFPFNGMCATDSYVYLPPDKSQHNINDLVPAYIPKIPLVYTGQKTAWGADGGSGHEGDNDFLIVGVGFSPLGSRICNQGWQAEWVYCYETGEIWINGDDVAGGSYLKDLDGNEIRRW